MYIMILIMFLGQNGGNGIDFVQLGKQTIVNLFFYKAGLQTRFMYIHLME